MSNKTKTRSPKPNQAMPHNLDAERSLLGALMIDATAFDRVAGTIKAGDFYLPAHSSIFEAIANLAGKGKPADIVTLTDYLASTGELEKTGGAAAIAELMEAVPTAANVAHYAEIVREKAMLREVIGAASGIVAEGIAGVEDAREFIDRAEAHIFEAAEKRVESSFVKLIDILGPSIEMAEKFYEQGGLTGVPTGFRDLDLLTAGLQPSDLVIIAGRPSMGKTALALNIAAHAALYHKIGVGVFSLEMSRQQLTMRLLCSEGRINYLNLRGGTLPHADWPKLTSAAGKLSEAPIYIDDTPGVTIFDVRAKARRLASGIGDRRSGFGDRTDPRPSTPSLGLIIIDYIQLMAGSGSRSEQTREQEISAISRTLKGLARELGLPVVALSQLSRQPERRADMRPILSDLRESGAIEQDADLIMFIYREELYRKDAEKGVAEIIVGKQRMGPTGVRKLTFLADYTRFEDYAEEPRL